MNAKTKRFSDAVKMPVTMLSRSMGKDPGHVGRLLRTDGGCTVRSLIELKAATGLSYDELIGLLVDGQPAMWRPSGPGKA